MERQAKIFVALAATIVLCGGAARAAEQFRYPQGKHGKGELRYVNGVPVLLVQGSPSEIGAQIGSLALKPFVEANRELIDQALGGKLFGLVLATAVKTGSLMLPQFPPDQVVELDAIAKAGGLPRDLLIVGNTVHQMILPNIGRLFQCSSLIVEGERSATGTPLFGRNLDCPIGRFPLHEFTLVTVYRPDGKRAFASIGFPGMIGCAQGVNDAGLALVEHSVDASADGSPSMNVAGTSYVCALRRVLEECATVGDAESLLHPLRATTMSIVAVCDKQRGSVFEVTTKQLVVRDSVDAVCACTNHFRTRQLAVDVACSRFAILETCREMKRLDLADVAEKMDEVGNDSTVQTMVFDPAQLKLHLAYGPPPASQLPLAALDLSELFSKGEFPVGRAPARRKTPASPPRTTEIEDGKYEVVFRYRPVGRIKENRSVYLAGTFNDWDPTGLKMSGPDDEGYYRKSMQLRDGRYEYKFVIDGKRWRPDPTNGARTGPYRNSVIEVGR